jgi:hypothetical protein
MIAEIQPDEYKKLEGLSYSKLSRVWKNPADFGKEPGPPTQDMIRGTLVDMELLHPEEKVDDYFYFSEVDPPGDKTGELLNMYLESGGAFIEKDGKLAVSDGELLLNCRHTLSYQLNWLEPTFFSKFTEACSAYATDLMASEGRTLIGPSMKATVDRICHTLLTHPYWDFDKLFSGPGYKGDTIVK